jgi:hypothetical protein
VLHPECQDRLINHSASRLLMPHARFRRGQRLHGCASSNVSVYCTRAPPSPATPNTHIHPHTCTVLAAAGARGGAARQRPAAVGCAAVEPHADVTPPGVCVCGYIQTHADRCKAVGGDRCGAAWGYIQTHADRCEAVAWRGVVGVHVVVSPVQKTLCCGLHGQAVRMQC